jgi:hypothetical protein
MRLPDGHMEKLLILCVFMMGLLGLVILAEVIKHGL